MKIQSAFLFAIPLLLASACVSTTYDLGPQPAADAQMLRGVRGGRPPRKNPGPVYIELGPRGELAALGRIYPDVHELAKHLRAAKASAAGGRHVVIRCPQKPDAVRYAESLRDALVREGVPFVFIQGPRTATSTLGPDRGF